MTYLKFGLPLAVVILWQFLSMQGILPYHRLPSPLEIAAGMKTLIIEGLPPGYLSVPPCLGEPLQGILRFLHCRLPRHSLGNPDWLVPKAQYPSETLY